MQQQATAWQMDPAATLRGVSRPRFPGTVVGTLMNDPALLAGLGDAVDRPPYKAAPRAPVLYLKPRNTLAASGAAVAVPADPGELSIGAALGMVIGRTACRVTHAEALDHLAGYVIVADLTVPHDVYYRPSVRHRARDGSCLIGPRVVPRAEVPDPDALAWQLRLDGAVVQRSTTGGRVRSAARLLADVTDFMTLQVGDILLLGISAGAPTGRAGQHFQIDFDGLGRLEGRLVAEADVGPEADVVPDVGPNADAKARMDAP